MIDAPIRVLTIDDEQYVRKSIRYFLEDCDYDVIEAENGKIGLAMFHEHRPDLVLVDLRMPEVDGLEVLSKIQASDPEVPVIVVSGNGAMRDVVEALRLGAWDYLVKPIEDLSVLKHALDKAMERARLVRENRQYREHLEEIVALRTGELEEANQGLQNLINRLHRVVETTRHISGFSRMDRFGPRLLEEFGFHMSASGGSLYVRRGEGFELVHSLDPGHAVKSITLPPPGGSILFDAFTTTSALLIEDVEQWEKSRSGWLGYESGSALVFPLLGEEDKVIGLLSLHSRKNHSFTMEDKEIGSVLASYSGEALAAAWAATAVKESEERKELALQGASLGMWDWNVPLGTMIFDKRSEEILGYGPNQLEETVETWESHVHEEDLEVARHTLDTHLKGLTPHFQCEYRVQTRDGFVRWVMDRGRVVSRDENGEPVRVTGTHLDITDRKEAEIALKASEEKFRAILENNPVPMIITDAMTRVENINRAFMEQFAYEASDILEMSRFWQCAFPDEEQRLAAMDIWSEAVRGLASSATIEWRITRGDGNTRDVEVKVMTLGTLTVTALNDVTERKLAERRVRELNQELAIRVQTRTAQLEATREKLEDANQRAGMADIATGTIHNIGNILTSFNVSTGEVSSRLENSKIRSLVVAGELLNQHRDNLVDYLTNDPKGRQIPDYFLAVGKRISKEYEQLKQEIASLSNSIDIMRDVITTQQSYARQVDNSERVALADIVEHAIKLQKHTLERCHADIIRDFQVREVGNYPRVKLTHVLINLIKNACEAMEGNAEMGRLCQLKIKLGAESERYYIAVTDNGHGIGPDALKKMFKHGFTTKPTGHGFGLHTSCHWMHELGGSMQVNSEGLDKGATFIMYFPEGKRAASVKGCPDRI